MKKERPAYDMNLLCAVLALVALGLVMVFSASQGIAREHFNSPFFFMQQHAIRMLLGLCALIVFMRIPYGVYRRLAPWIICVAMALLAATLFRGVHARGASRWLYVFSFTIQPVEIAKIALVIFFSAWIADGKRPPDDLKRGYLPLAAVAAAMALMVALQPNISNAVLIMALALALLFSGGCRLRHLAASAAVAAAAAFPFLYSLAHVRERIFVVLNKGADVQGLGWHVNQSLIALGSGFVFGCGAGGGHQKYLFLPDAHTDFIYSIIGEELGFIGTATVLALFAYIFLRSIRIAGRAPNLFGYLLAVGIGLTLSAGAMVNMAMTTGLAPTAGLPLPFVSYGGSSLVMSLAAVGVLLNISAQGKDVEQAPGRLRSVHWNGKQYARRARRAAARER